MKNVILGLMITVVSAFQACAQGQVPLQIKASFESKFANAKSVQWEIENDTEWEAEFKLNRKEMSANFDLNGNLLETETEIKVKDLPPAVLETIKNEFADYKIEEAEKVEKPDGTFLYEVELEKGKEEIEVIFPADGKFMRKALSEEEKED